MEKHFANYCRAAEGTEELPRTLADDLLNGAVSIGAFLGWPPRRIYYEAELERAMTSGFPVFRVGSHLTARKSSLLKWIATQEDLATGRAIKPIPTTIDMETGDRDDRSDL